MNDLFSIKGKIALITGAGSGIGAAIAEGFEEVGAVVFRGNHHLNKKTEVEPLVYQLDIEDSKSRSKLMKEIHSRYGKLDILVNAVGITFPGYSKVDWDRTLKVNLTSVYDMCNYAKYFMELNGGSIINITSINANMAGSNNPAYNVSKAGLELLSKSIAKDWAKNNIRVNNLTLGYFKTKMTQKSQDDPIEYKKRCERIMINRFGDVSEVIGPAIFLASDASSYITGSNIIVDGGFSSNGI